MKKYFFLFSLLTFGLGISLITDLLNVSDAFEGTPLDQCVEVTVVGNDLTRVETRGVVTTFLEVRNHSRIDCPGIESVHLRFNSADPHLVSRGNIQDHKLLERLRSGLRINSSHEDAAGLLTEPGGKKRFGVVSPGDLPVDNRWVADVIFEDGREATVTVTVREGRVNDLKEKRNVLPSDTGFAEGGIPLLPGGGAVGGAAVTNTEDEPRPDPVQPVDPCHDDDANVVCDKHPTCCQLEECTEDPACQ